jgi:Mrp family chromosome partitioning ATPase
LPIESGLRHVSRALDPIWSRVDAALRSGQRRVLFVAPEHSSGTTILAAACAIGLTRNLHRRVVLAELNPFTPALADDFGLSHDPGWSDVWTGKALLREALRPSGIGALSVMPGGSPGALQAGLFASSEARARLAELTSGEEEAVILDSPPFLDHPEALVLLEYCDAALVVLRSRRTRKTNALRTIHTIRQARVPLLGAILNRFVPDLPFGIGRGLQAGTSERKPRS